MRKPIVHKRRETIQPSFPNNRLSNRRRKREAEKREWIIEETDQYLAVPANAIFTPFDIPNPRDNSPSRTTGFTLRACDWGDGQEPAEERLGGGCVQHGGVLTYPAQPISGMEIGRPCGIGFSQGVRGRGCFVETAQVASQCNRRAPIITSSANDGQEIFGFRLTWMQQDSGKIISTNVTGITASPVDARNIIWHSTETGTLDTTMTTYGRDINGDGISDWAESTANTTGRTDPNHPYHWYVTGHNWTEIQNQFNPFMKENIPPVIEDTAFETKTKWDLVGIFWVPIHSWAIVDINITDVAPYWGDIKIIDSGDSVSFTGQPGTNWHHAVLNIDYLTDVLLDYTVNITATDTAGNGVAMDHKVDGIIVGLANVFAYLMWGWMADAWEAVKEGMDIFSGIIIEIVNGIINEILNPLITEVNNWMTTIANIILSMGTMTLEAFIEVLWTSLLFSPIFLAITAVVVGASVAEKITYAMSGGAASLLSLVSNIIVGAIIGILLVATISELTGSGILENIIPNWFDDMTDWSFTIAEVLFMWGLKQRALNPIKGVEIALILSIMSLITLGVGSVITKIAGESERGALAVAFIDVVALALAVWGAAKGLELAGRGVNFVKMFYPLLFPIMIALDVIGIASSASAVVISINTLATWSG